MGQVFALMLPRQEGPCEICHKPGWQQVSIVDPCSPALKFYCKTHHQEHDEKTQRQRNKCRYCDEYKDTFIVDEIHNGAWMICLRHNEWHQYVQQKCKFCDCHENTFVHHHLLCPCGKERVCIQHALPQL